jgi:hypothetical protein
MRAIVSMVGPAAVADSDVSAAADMTRTPLRRWIAEDMVEVRVGENPEF